MFLKMWSGFLVLSPAASYTALSKQTYKEAKLIIHHDLPSSQPLPVRMNADLVISVCVGGYIKGEERLMCLGEM